MKTILFDLFTAQAFVGGAGEYVRRVLYALLEAIRTEKVDVHVVGLIDSVRGKTVYSDLTPEHLRNLGVEVIDLKGDTLHSVFQKRKFDKVFIGAAQYWGGSFDVENIPCPVLCVVHDLVDEEFATSYIPAYLKLSHPYQFLRHMARELKCTITGEKGVSRMKNIMNLYRKNTSCQIITVSEYTRMTLEYHFQIPSNRICVLYSPPRISSSHDEIDNGILREILREKKEYFLLLNANRYTKNPEKAIHAFQQYANTPQGEGKYLVTIGYQKSHFPQHITLPYLSESDLAHVMKNAYALLFPSVFEGFGYPPVEAMGYGVPVLSSNVTSMPEILGDAPLYFSPFYESDIFRTLCALDKNNRKLYSARSLARHQQIRERQEADLHTLTKMLIE